MLIMPEPYGPRGLLEATGDKWGDKRHSLTPAFSAAKMKMVRNTELNSPESAFKSINYVDGTIDKEEY